MLKKWTQRISFRLHQWIGLLCAVVFLVIGATGSLLALEEPIKEIWPNQYVVSGDRYLSPVELMSALRLPGKKVSRLYLEDDRSAPGRVLYLDTNSRAFEFRAFGPFTGGLFPDQPSIDSFFSTVRALHRWLLLPHSVGSVITGSATLMAIVLLIAGIVRRAPDKLASLRSWFAWKKGTKGRHALWQYHALLGTWVFVPLLIVALTGPHFGFDWYRQGMHALFGSSTAQAPLHSQPGTPDLAKVWRGYLSVRPDGQFARWYMPRSPGKPITVRYFEDDAPHSHAYSSVTLDAVSGEILAERRFSELTGGEYLLANLYALHTGLFFGLPGSIIWSLSALAFASFSVTGVWLFFNRRARPKDKTDGEATTLITYASQSGTAAACGQRLQDWLAGQGQRSHLLALGNLLPEQLSRYRRVLILASTYGEGHPPDNALAFKQKLAQSAPSLQGIEIAVLAFGDRQYQQFCAFGHWLAERFTALGARLLLPVTEVDRGAQLTITAWHQRLAEHLSLNATTLNDGWQTATLLNHRCLNPESQRPVYDLQLQVEDTFCAGDILECLPVLSEAQVKAMLATSPLTGDEAVRLHEQSLPLWQALAEHLEYEPYAGGDVQQWLEQLSPLAARSYSIASCAGAARLMVRLFHKDDGTVGRASGLLAELTPGALIHVRVKRHPGFHLPATKAPLILLGAGTGLAPYLGFLEQLRQQSVSVPPVWLVFGERHAASDDYYRQELTEYLEQGVLHQLDLAWSRDRGEYVQDVLRRQLSLLDTYLRDGAHIYVCGSIDGIGQGVRQLLLEYLGAEGIAELVQQERLHRDLY